MRKNKKSLFFVLLLSVLLLTGCERDVIKSTGDNIAERLQKKAADILLPEENIPEADAAQTSNDNYIPYGYECLGEEEQKIYRQYLAGIMERSETVTVTANSQEQINKAVNMVFADHPEIFWLDQSVYYFENEGEMPQGSTAELQLTYNMEVSQIDDRKTLIEQKADEWLAGVPQEGDAYGKVRYIYELLSSNVTYDEASENNQNIQSVFLNQRTVCMGYSKATQYLLGRMGIFCTLVTGTAAPENEEHAWNLVKLGDNYYYVDTTWGNPGFTEQQEGAVGEISYTYLCCTTDTLLSTHTPDDTMPLPQCTDDSYNYYKINGTWYDSYDEGTVYSVLADSLNQGYEKAEFKFGSEEAYSQAVEAMVNGDLVDRVVQDNYDFQGEETFRWNIGYSPQERLLSVYW